jgi:hypothetical protein
MLSSLIIDHEIPEVKEFQIFPLNVQTSTCVLFECCDEAERFVQEQRKSCV